MRIPRIVCALLIISATCVANVRAEWMTFFGSGVASVGTWPGGSALSGAALVSASNFTNGIPSTPFIGLTPITIPNLSPDYFATGLQPNPGPVVTMIGTPYNDTGDKYHVVVDFTATTGGANPGTLPAGSVFAIIDLDISENYRKVSATDPSGNPITTPWISGPNAFFDMTNPMTPTPAITFGSSPTLTGPVSGVYEMLGVVWNDDSEMWLFQTTQDVKTIAFDMEVNSGNINVGGGGAGWAFYTSPIPEPTSVALVCSALVIGGCAFRRERRE
jgi:hypothetical protein